MLSNLQAKQLRLKDYIALATLCIVITGFCGFIFLWFPSVYEMAANADSLVLLDFARDVLTQAPIQQWNLPRAPYLFPDTVIALAVIGLGWHGKFTILIIASINCLILLGVSKFILSQSAKDSEVSLWRTALMLGSSVLLLGAIFPNMMSNLYWQLFASGAHMLTAVIVALIFFLANPQPGQRLKIGTLILIGLLTFAEAISDSMALLLIAAWWPMQFWIRRKYLRNSYIDLIVIPLMLVLGTFSSFFLPRQELVGSFFSLTQFTNSIKFFISWALSSWLNYGALICLFGLTLSWPFLQKGTWPKNRSDISNLICNNFFLPAMAIFFATPLFYQEIGSMRYLSFPALVSVLSLSLVGMRVTRWLKDKSKKIKGLVISVGSISIISLATWSHSAQQSTITHEVTSIDKIGLSSAVENVPLALICIDQASATYPLEDGIATYWSARPIHFASQFERYLAQINPWRPRSGYFLWGNNGRDFVFKRTEPPSIRKYNYIIATNHEIDNGLWTAIAKKASAKVVCQENTVYYFSNENTLWDYLFPFNLPFHLSPPEHLIKSPDSSFFAPEKYEADELFTQVGKRKNDQIIAHGKSGFLVFGPYIPLTAGRYRLSAMGTLSSLENPNDPIGNLDIVTNGGNKMLLQIPIPAQQVSRGVILATEFIVDTPVIDAEFRMAIFNQVRGEFSYYYLEKINP